MILGAHFRCDLSSRLKSPLALPRELGETAPLPFSWSRTSAERKDSSMAASAMPSPSSSLLSLLLPLLSANSRTSPVKPPRILAAAWGTRVPKSFP